MQVMLRLPLNASACRMVREDIYTHTDAHTHTHTHTCSMRRIVSSRLNRKLLLGFSDEVLGFAV